MAIQTFVASTVLTAAQMNALQANDYNQTVSTKTASYVLVAADKGTKVVMNAGATNTTITVNTSLFSAGDTLTILNTSTSGTCTITAGTATVATAGSLALGLNQGGILYFTSAGVSVFQANGVTASASALTLISATTIGTTVASVTVSSAFSSTYDNYLITIAGGVGSALAYLQLQLGSQTSGYYGGAVKVSYSGTVTGAGDSNAAQMSYVGWCSTTAMCAQITVNSPNLAKVTSVFAAPIIDATNSISYNAQDNAATQFTAFTIKPSTGTLTAGTIRVYGYANS